MSRRGTKGLPRVAIKREEEEEDEPFFPPRRSGVAPRLPVEGQSEEESSLFVGQREDRRSSRGGADNEYLPIEENVDADDDDNLIQAAPTSTRTSVRSAPSVNAQVRVPAQPARPIGRFGSQDGWIKPKRKQTEGQKMKWTPANDRKLLLFALGREILPSQYQIIADSFPEKPTAKAVGERLVKLRAEQLALLNKLGMTPPEADLYNPDGTIRYIAPAGRPSRKRPQQAAEQDSDDDVEEIEDPRLHPLPPAPSKENTRRERAVKRPRVAGPAQRVSDVTEEMPSYRRPPAPAQRTTTSSAREAVAAAPTPEAGTLSTHSRPILVDAERPGRFSLGNIPGGHQIFDMSRRASASASISRPPPSLVRPRPTRVAAQSQYQTQSQGQSQGPYQGPYQGQGESQYWTQGENQGQYRRQSQSQGGSDVSRRSNLGPRGGGSSSGLGPRAGHSSRGGRGSYSGSRGGSGAYGPLGPRGGSFGSYH